MERKFASTVHVTPIALMLNTYSLILILLTLIHINIPVPTVVSMQPLSSITPFCSRNHDSQAPQDSNPESCACAHNMYTCMYVYVPHVNCCCIYLCTCSCIFEGTCTCVHNCSTQKQCTTYSCVYTCTLPGYLPTQIQKQI